MIAAKTPQPKQEQLQRAIGMDLGELMRRQQEQAHYYQLQQAREEEAMRRGWGQSHPDKHYQQMREEQYLKKMQATAMLLNPTRGIADDK
jgi:hypothetical protein